MVSMVAAVIRGLKQPDFSLTNVNVILTNLMDNFTNKF